MPDEGFGLCFESMLYGEYVSLNFKTAFGTESCCPSDSSRGDTQGSSRLSLFTLILGNTFTLKCWAESLMLHKALSALTLGTSGCICKLPVCMRWLHSNVNFGGTHWPEIRRRALPQLPWGLEEVLNLPKVMKWLLRSLPGQMVCGFIGPRK